LSKISISCNANLVTAHDPAALGETALGRRPDATGCATNGIPCSCPWEHHSETVTGFLVAAICYMDPGANGCP